MLTVIVLEVQGWEEAGERVAEWPSACIQTGLCVFVLRYRWMQSGVMERVTCAEEVCVQTPSRAGVGERGAPTGPEHPFGSEHP